MSANVLAFLLLLTRAKEPAFFNDANIVEREVLSIRFEPE